MIKILGTRGEVAETAKGHTLYSGVLVDNLLFDLGEKEFLKCKPKAIFISHYHPDHAYFIKEKEAPELKGISIFAPEIWKGFQKDHVPIKVKKAQPIKLNDFKITPIPTTHSEKVKSCGYLIEIKGKKILYTSDMIWINKRYHPLIKNCDLVITEGSFFKKGGMIRRDKKTGRPYGHQGIPNLVDLFKRLGAKQIVTMHFGAWLIKNPKEGYQKIKELGDEIKVWAAKDGEKIELEDLAFTTEDIPKLLKEIVMKIKARVCPFCNKIFPSDEALKKHMKKEHPKEYSRLKEYLSKPNRGLYLVSPHGKMIFEGKKSLIVKKKKFKTDPNEALYLIEKGLCYGYIYLGKPVEIGYDDFERLASKHKIKRLELIKWWTGLKKDPKELTNKELEELYRRLIK